MPLYMDIHIVDSDTFSVEDVVNGSYARFGSGKKIWSHPTKVLGK